ncbi:MAG: hypothetical protein ACRCXZ_03485 [Patescibacteria group bacterium]
MFRLPFFKDRTKVQSAITISSPAEVEIAESVLFDSGLIKFHPYDRFEVVDRNELMEDHEYARFVINFLTDNFADHLKIESVNKIDVAKGSFFEVDVFVKDGSMTKLAARFFDFVTFENNACTVFFYRKKADRICDSTLLSLSGYQRIYVTPNQYNASAICAIQFRLMKGNSSSKSTIVFD